MASRPSGDAGSIAFEKHFFRIGEVAALVGVEPHVLRYWQKEFRALKPEKNAAGHRVYRRADVELLRRIRSMLHDEGLTIAGARARLRGERGEPRDARALDDPTIERIRTGLRGAREEVASLLDELGS